MIVVIVPAYNEEKTIGRVIRDLFEHGYENVVVVDDGSSDNTAEISARSGAKVVRHLFNRGQGAALQTGDRHALAVGADVVVHFDADGQFTAKDIAGAVRMITEKNLDIVLGSRFLDSRSKIPFVKKYLILPCAKFINYLLTGTMLTDAHNGFRVMSRSALKVLKITQDGMAHNSEIVAQIKKYGLKFAEYPVEVVYHEFGQGIEGGIKIIRDIIFSKFLR